MKGNTMFNMQTKSTARLFVILLAGCGVMLSGCGAGDTGDDDGSGEDLAEVSTASSAYTVASPACAGCAPPFVERPQELEFSGELIVRSLHGAASERDRMARQRLAPHVLRHHPEVDEYVIRVPARYQGRARGEGENRMAAELMATGDYHYVTPNWVVSPSASPNDPLYSSQWHLPKIQGPQAWDLQKGSSTMILAFTDTGIDRTHPDLAARRVPGYNAVTGLDEANGGDVSDVHGHGTHVAGCAAAIGNNTTGVSGVGWNFGIMMVRVSDLSSGYATLENITSGARWAAEHGAKVVSSSYSGADSPSVGTTGTYIKSRGALYLYGAGNDGRNLSSFDHPDVIIVGATDQNDARASFSAYGSAVDVFSPGVNILSTLNGGSYGQKNGTSMATPIANGVAGMIWSVNSNFTPAQVESFLFSSCDDLGSPGEDSTYGWGRVNVYRGVQAARAAACTHSKCTAGTALGDGCEACTTSICAVDPYCCSTEWDSVCVDEVMLVCGIACN
jgi:subtilisin family serine protease